MTAQREMTLDEWCAKLPDIHQVNVEYRALKAQQETDWEGVAADQAMTIALMKSEQPEQEPNGYVQTVIEALYENGDPVSVDAAELLQRITAQPEQEPLEYWNAVEGWVKIDEVRQHFETVSCGTIYKTAGEGRVPLYTAPPKEQQSCDKRELKSTTDMMMELADRLGELPDDVDPRAWEHLLVYAPKPDLTDAERKSYQAGHNAGVAHHKQAIKREWVGLTDEEIDAVTNVQWGGVSGQPLAAHRAYARAIEDKLKELNT